MTSPQPTAPPAEDGSDSRWLLASRISALKARVSLERIATGETRAAEICSREIAVHVATLRHLDALHAAETDPALQEAVDYVARYVRESNPPPGSKNEPGYVRDVLTALLSLVPSLSPSPSGEPR